VLFAYFVSFYFVESSLQAGFLVIVSSSERHRQFLRVESNLLAFEGSFEEFKDKFFLVGDAGLEANRCFLLDLV